MLSGDGSRLFWKDHDQGVGRVDGRRVRATRGTRVA